jgi:hypothetical protein
MTGGVGFGDITPKTSIGHIIASVCIVWGSLNTSTMVLVLVNVFSLNKSMVYYNVV